MTEEATTARVECVDHNCIPCRGGMRHLWRKGWVCVRCNRWFRFKPRRECSREHGPGDRCLHVMSTACIFGCVYDPKSAEVEAKVLGRIRAASPSPKEPVIRDGMVIMPDSKISPNEVRRVGGVLSPQEQEQPRVDVLRKALESVLPLAEAEARWSKDTNAEERCAEARAVLDPNGEHHEQ